VDVVSGEAAGLRPAVEPGSLPRRNELTHTPNRPAICGSLKNQAFLPGGKMPASTAAMMARRYAKHIRKQGRATFPTL